MPHACVNAAAIRIQATDNHVVDPDQNDERAHRRDEPKRRIARDCESETDDVGLTGAPIAIQNRRSTRDVDVAWTLYAGWNQILTRNRDWLARRAVSLLQARLGTAALAL